VINLRGQPRVIKINGTVILRGLFFPNSNEETLLHLAACEKIELHSTSKDWNFVLRGLMEISRRAGSHPMTGTELNNLRMILPVNFN
tara:strand:+ start:46154 stop:46414 length:261 start_codon:yes stop_codon:yes gene_type:complete